MFGIWETITTINTGMDIILFFCDSAKKQLFCNDVCTPSNSEEQKTEVHK